MSTEELYRKISENVDLEYVKSVLPYKPYHCPLQYLSTEEKENVHIHEVSLTSANQAVVTALLVTPRPNLRKNYPALILLHGGGQNRYTFLENAMNLASKGFVCMLPDSPAARPEPYRISYLNYGEAQKDFRAYTQNVRDMQACFVALCELGYVDTQNIGFVGFSKGAWTGAQLAGLNIGIKTFILMACSGSQTWDLIHLNEEYLNKTRLSLSQEQLNNYLKIMGSLDPIHHLKLKKESSIFFQFANSDPYVTDDMADLSFFSATNPKKRKNYESKHEGLSYHEEATNDRMNWLIKELIK